jgi:hypothetical protein
MFVLSMGLIEPVHLDGVGFGRYGGKEGRSGTVYHLALAKLYSVILAEADMP